MIELQQLSIGYHHSIAKALNVRFPEGKITALLGANGCGKTTLLKTILKLLKPLQGHILIQNKPVQEWKNLELAKTIAYVPQAQQGIFAFRVVDMVLMGRTAYLPWFATPSKQDKQLAQQSLTQLGIAHLADKSYMALSGGERQLVLIARALTQQAHCIIMDEPTSNLDFGNQIRLLEQLQQLRKQGLTLIFTTHQPEQAFRYADHILLMYQGEIIKQGAPEEVIDLPLLAKIYHLSPEVLTKNLNLTKG